MSLFRGPLHTPRFNRLALAVATGLSLATFDASAQSSSTASALAQMKAEIEALQSRIAELEAQQRQQAAAQAETTKTVQATQQQIQTTNTQIAASRSDREPGKKKKFDLGHFDYKGLKVTLGGYLESAGLYRSKTLGSDIASKYGSIPYRHVGGPGAHTSETRITERQSRLSLLVQGDPSDTVHLAGYYELDFQGAAQSGNSNESNSFNPRTRNVYLTMDWDTYGLHLLGGQNWSLATMNEFGIVPRNEVTTPGVIDAQYVPGFVWTRQAQFRLVKDWNKKWWLGFSVENPQTPKPGGSGPKGVYTQDPTYNSSGFASAPSMNSMPDLIAKFAADPGYGHYEVFGIGRGFKDVVGSKGNNKTHTTYGGGYGLGMILPFFNKQVDFQLSGLRGRGIGRYGSASLPDVTYNSNGSLRPIKETMLLTGITWHVVSSVSLFAYAGEERNQKTSTGENQQYGYGNYVENSACFSEAAYEGGSSLYCNSNTKKIWQGTLGGWWTFYKGSFGKTMLGLQYSHTERKGFKGTEGTPSGKDDMAFISLRYYPF